MRTNTQFGLKVRKRDSYFALMLAFPLASIKSDEHLAQAQKVMDRLLAQGELDDGQEMYLDALSDLVGAPKEVSHGIGLAVNLFVDKS